MPRTAKASASTPIASGPTRQAARRLGLVTACEYHAGGCRHIYDYTGRDPFRDIPELVAAHQRECVGVGVGRKSGFGQHPHPHACQRHAAATQLLPRRSPGPHGRHRQ
uniref:Uncharacterized protein n=1 Tax=Mycena chlorophos TaxID=658473 RepID=A0ABQ0LJK6_MYCCL|nr:predicted protein [Mycena chlorophos]